MREGLYFRYLRLPNDGVVTFVISVDVETRWVQYSYSLCSPKDQFDKSWGKHIAAGRLSSDRRKRVSGFRLPVGFPMNSLGMIRKVEEDFIHGAATRQPFAIRPSWLIKGLNQLEDVRYEEVKNRYAEANAAIADIAAAKEKEEYVARLEASPRA